MATALDAPQIGTQAEQLPAMAFDALRSGTRPPRGLSGAERLVGGQLDELCDVFRPILPFMMAWDILRKQSTRSA